MAARRAPDVWLRRKGGKKNGKPDSWYFRKVRLRTKDAVEARERARLVQLGTWPPPQEAAAVTAAAFAIPEPPPPAPAPPPPAPPPSPAPAPPPLTGDWTHAATGAASEASPDEPIEAQPQVSSEQLAELLVTGELALAEMYVQRKVYKAFVAPEIAPEGRAMLVKAYRAILDYGGTTLVLPPWVQGVVVPSLTVVISSMAIVAGFRDSALEQKRTAEGGA